MPVKRKDKENDTPAANKRVRREKTDDLSDEDLSDIDDGGEIFNGVRIPAELPPITSADENPGPRMIIKNIVANNFKSYYGEVTIGPFHKSLTSIVGANGSGKSNVIDSLLFVFGYRSTKIRSKKVSVLLHKSDRHKDVSQCSVTVNFVLIHDDDSQDTGFVAIPGSEISITRTAFKDNTSFYTLNNKRVKFKDVATILKKNGIDLIHNRFLILQGEVEQIAMMKPKAENDHSTGMLEYLEDVIGTVRYKKPITKLEEKLQVISMEKSEKMTRMKFVAKDREELVELALKAVRFIKLENNYTRFLNKDTQFALYKKNKIYESKKEERNKIKDELNSINDELEAIEESKKEKKKMLDDLSKKLASDIKKSANYRKKYDSSIEADKKMQNDIKMLETQIKNNEKSINLEKKKISKSESIPKLKEAELKQLQSEIEPLENERRKLEEIYEKINSSGFEKSKKFREEKDVLDPELSKLKKLVGIKQNQFQALKTEFEVLLDSEKFEKEKLKKLEEQMINGTDELKENMRKKQEAESEIQNSRETIKDMERNIEKLKNEEKQMQTNLQNVRQSLSEKRTAYAETTERSRPIQYILKLKDNREIPGLLGRCGDYGQVEGKYDIPACTACGSTDQIVVETSDAAHACIHKLKTNNIGRLTFSILPQVQKLKPRADSNNKYPENAKRVFDFIQILDQRFRLTFYSGLYDTLLAEDLEQARRIAFGTQTRYRVVTYKGDLIDQSGIMSGGGKAIKGKIGPQETSSRFAGGNKSQVSRNEVESLDKIIQDLEVKLRQNQSNIDDFRANIERHHLKIEELNVIVRQCTLRINAWKAKENQVKSMIEAQQLVIVKKKTDPIAVANKEAEIKKAEKEFEKAQVECNQIKSKVEELIKKIADITEGEPREAKRLFDETSNKLDNTRSKILQVDIDLQAAERQIKKSETQIEKLTGYINEMKEKINSNKEEILKNSKLLEEQLLQLEEVNRIIDEQKEKIKNITNEEDENTARKNELRKNEIKLKQDLEKIESIVKEIKEECKILKHQLSKLKFIEVPNIDSKLRDPVQEAHKIGNPDCEDPNKSSSEETEQSKKSPGKDKNSPEKDKNSPENDKNSPEEDDNSDDINDPYKVKIDDDDALNNSEDLVQYTNEQLAEIDYDELHFKGNILTEELTHKCNYNVLEEYQKRNQQYNERADEVVEILLLYNDHIKMINKVRQRRRDEFMASFRKITIKLKEMYQMITLGGDAELELSDSLDPFSEGVSFSVRPPKKTWKVISNLSGGEKTLSSLALVFALHYYKPSPLYVMDEIDAALDFKNVSIIAYYIKERTKNSQFIIISLRSNMFEKANLLVGIFKTNDCTQTVSIRTNAFGNEVLGALAECAEKED